MQQLALMPTAQADETGAPVAIVMTIIMGFASLLLTLITLVVTRLGHNIDKLSDRLDAGQRNLGDRLDATQRDLGARIDATQRDLAARIDGGLRELGDRLDAGLKDMGCRGRGISNRSPRRGGRPGRCGGSQRRRYAESSRRTAAR